MSGFVNKYLDPNKNLRILDVGSYDVNGTYKKLFEKRNWQYFGLDIQPGPNVDIVAKELYNWGIKEEYDIIISGQTLEHVKDTHKFMKAIYKAIKPGGLVCIIAPSVSSQGISFAEHRYPVDCWRIMTDGMTFLLEEICDFDVIKVWIQEDDCIGIGIARNKKKKPKKRSNKSMKLLYRKK